MRTTRHLANMGDVLVRDSGAGDGSFTIKGHAAVFNQWSHPLGYSGFLEQIAPGAFTNALTKAETNGAGVVSVWDHDTRWLLGTTQNNTLDMEQDATGLGYWTRVAPTSYAADLRILLERGDISQCSFCFTIARESWTWVEETETGKEQLYATVEEVEDLFDVTVCAQGAYPQTDIGISNNLYSNARSRMETALREGRVPGLTFDDARSRGIISAGNPNGAPRTAPEGVAASVTGDDVKRAAWLVSAEASVDVARATMP